MTLSQIETELNEQRAKYWDTSARLAYLALAALALRVLEAHPDARFITAEYTDEPGTPHLVFGQIVDLINDPLADDWDDTDGDGYLLDMGTRGYWEFFCTRVDNRRGEFTFDIHQCRDEALALARREEPYPS